MKHSVYNEPKQSGFLGLHCGWDWIGVREKEGGNWSIRFSLCVEFSEIWKINNKENKLNLKNNNDVENCEGSKAYVVQYKEVNK